MKKITVALVATCAIALLLGGCANTKISTVPIECEDPSKPCAYFVKEGNDFWGGGRTTLAGIAGTEICTEIDADGKEVQVRCGIHQTVGGINPDRGDTILPTLLDVTGKVSGDILQYKASVYRTKNTKSSPAVLNVVQQSQGQSANPVALSEGGDSLAGATSLTNTEVGVGIDTSDCPTCHDPRPRKKEK